MSIEVVVFCEGCRRSVATGPTPASARRVLLSEGGMVNKPGGEDFCARCTKGMRDRPSLMRQAERRWSAALA